MILYGINIFEYIDMLNGNKFFWGVTMLLLNFGSRKAETSCLVLSDLKLKNTTVSPSLILLSFKMMGEIYSSVSPLLYALESADSPFRAVVNVTNVISRKLLVPVLIRNIASKKVRILRVEPRNVTVTAMVD